MSGERIFGASGFVHNNVVVNLSSRPHDERRTYTDEYDVQPLEFVTVTGTSTNAPHRDVSRIVRSQAMRDYVWRQNHPALTSKMAAAHLQEKPQRIFESKFRVGSKARQQKKPAKPRRSIKGPRTNKECNSASEAQLINRPWLIRQSLMPDKNLLMRGGAFSDPFDSFQFPLGPEGERFLLYYQHAYSVNCIALNLTPECFYYVREEVAMFHAVMYLVSLDYNLRYGFIDSPGSLYHGREAFRLINKGLEVGVIRDTLIAAVSLIIARENIAGQFDQGKIHMKGLQLMVEHRGGIKNIVPGHRGVVTWADLSYSNIWGSKPSFPLPLEADRSDTSLPDSLQDKMLSPENIFGAASPVNPALRSLRRISTAFSSKHHAGLDRKSIGEQIYSVECELLALRNDKSEALKGDQYISSRSVLMVIAAYTYLYMELRESLNMQDKAWWNSIPYRQRWLLWVLFVGYGAASEWSERRWFIENMEPLATSLMVWTKEEFQIAFKGVIWEDSRKELLEKLWRDISLRDRSELGNLAPSNS
ncbi:hypothetical protein BBK36DRAFT_1169268 [Trichoderma citrinoviride]|uniref:Tachykinin family protein n=1 Tax=Trichoderma citrinoviride TaxID=58853 RepID=A0A2T4B897_9HYPO|nr:hypothetical protein BBK36DRAFT_1169268 [Trichoderma citrinoviride]PTB65555.1 hypothetical protein BBK36DRAFT_1169268 [Trichoderma citrinoviride]